VMPLFRSLVKCSSPRLFAARSGKREQADEALKAQLYQQLGQLKVELDWVNKKLDLPVEAKRRLLEPAYPQISMDGRGRALDNIFVERLWRTVKYEDIYLNDYASVPALEAGLERYFTFYNRERPYQSLAYRTPAEVHWK